jgi:hypothetical protein
LDEKGEAGESGDILGSRSMIDQQLAAFLHDGIGIHLGTRNANLEPNGARAIALKVEQSARVTVYMADVAARRVMPDLEANGLAAVVCGRPVDERACQVKGRFIGARPASDSERAYATAQWDAFLGGLEYIGIPRSSAATWSNVAEVAIALEVTAVFEQTPGPDAGKQLS